MEIIINSLNDLPLVAQELLAIYKDKRVFAFFGEMGAGKTTLIKQLCDQLLVIERVNSPTFSIINEYFSSSNQTIYHADFYRIKNEQEAINIGFLDYLYSGSYCFIEWPENIYNLLPQDSVKVAIQILEGKRIITIKV